MSLHRRAAKRDAAEPDIVSALEALGCVVWRVSGKGLPDLIVFHPKARKPDGFGTHRHTFVADVKGPKDGPTPAQVATWTELTNLGFSVFILRTPEDAVAMLNNALAPWEPATSHPLGQSLSHTRPAVYRPRKGDATKTEGCGCRKKNIACIHTAMSYTPPRSAPVDAAKEAEVFAPPDLDTRECGCIGRMHTHECMMTGRYA